jgi:hypothetical protein
MSPASEMGEFTSWSATAYGQAISAQRRSRLKLASETKEIYAKMALIDLATEFRALADLEHLPRSV